MCRGLGPGITRRSIFHAGPGRLAAASPIGPLGVEGIGDRASAAVEVRALASPPHMERKCGGRRGSPGRATVHGEEVRW